MPSGPPAHRGGRCTTDTHWLTLGLAQGRCNQSLTPLLDAFGGPQGILRAHPAALRDAGLPPATVRALRDPDTAIMRRTESWLAEPGHCAVTWDDDCYPPLLREIPDPPVVLFLRGDPAVASLPQLAVVGSRNATPGGSDIARRFAARLGQAGFCITSGLARGIDAAAHTGALGTGAPTVAVCGTGPDIVYPAAHRPLAAEIATNGAVLTEFPPGTGPRPAHFPRRNRLISGLAVGVLVVEAGERSGALITARLAANQGREVFAVPGSIRQPLTRGCHRLLRQGATLVEDPGDIVTELGSLLAHCAQAVEQNIPSRVDHKAKPIEPEAKRLLHRMGWEPVSVDDLVRWTGLTTAELCSMLVTLELAGRVVSLTGSRFQRREEKAPI